MKSCTVSPDPAPVLPAGPFGRAVKGEDGSGTPVLVRRLAGLGTPDRLEAARELVDRQARCPMTVGILDVYVRDGDLFLVRPWLDDTGPPAAVEPRAAIATAARLARALEMLHERGLAHGHLSWTNVAGTGTERPVLLDAGLAELSGAGPPGLDRASGDVSALCGMLLSELGRDPGPPNRRLGRLLERTARHPGSAASLARLLDRMSVSGQPGRRGPLTPKLPVPTRRRVAVAVTVVLVGAATALHLVTSPGHGASLRPAALSCPEVDLPAGVGTTYGAVQVGGCPVPVAMNGNEVTTIRGGHVVSYRLGEPGDVLLTGRWDCASLPLPALYRPGTGAVYFLTGWPTPARSVTSRPGLRTGVKYGTPTVTRGRCQTVVVRGRT